MGAEDNLPFYYAKAVGTEDNLLFCYAKTVGMEDNLPFCCAPFLSFVIVHGRQSWEALHVG